MLGSCYVYHKVVFDGGVVGQSVGSDLAIPAPKVV